MADQEAEISFKKLLFPLTTFKAVHWIICIGILIYAVALLNGFVGDDNAQILDNSAIHSLTNFLSFFRGSTFHLSGTGSGIGLYYKPMLTISYAIMYAAFG